MVDAVKPNMLVVRANSELSGVAISFEWGNPSHPNAYEARMPLHEVPKFLQNIGNKTAIVNSTAQLLAISEDKPVSSIHIELACEQVDKKGYYPFVVFCGQPKKNPEIKHISFVFFYPAKSAKDAAQDICELREYNCGVAVDAMWVMSEILNQKTKYQERNGCDLTYV